MKKEDLTAYLDPLLTRARTKTDSMQDAEDLVSETILRALAAIEKGVEIEYPKAWLMHTLDHVWNDLLRKKYRRPIMVELTPELSLFSEDEYTFLDEDDEAADVRREVNRLSREYHAILVRYYWRGESVKNIAEAFGLPEGTVKSRLSGGREKIRKGLEEKMAGTQTAVAKQDKIPEKLNFANSGSVNHLHDFVEEDLIRQNILIEAYVKPISTVELSRRLGIPTVYLEPIVSRLVEKQLMKETPGGLVYTDFMIFTVDDQKRTFEKQLAFSKEHFDGFWSVIEEAKREVAGYDWWDGLNERQKQKLNAHLALRILQDFTLRCKGVDPDWEPYYKHTDEGYWYGWGYRYPAGFNAAELRELWDYTILGGLRSIIRGDVPGTKEFATFAFDTILCDLTDPFRFAVTGDMDMFFIHIGRVLWKAYNGEEPADDEEIPAAMLEAIPKFIEYGLLARDEDGRLTCDIPLMPQPDYIDFRDRIAAGAVEKLDSILGEDYRAFIKGTKIPIPAHLTGVPESLQYKLSSDYIPMAVLREAHERGLHLKDVDYPCPALIGCYIRA